MNTAPSRDRLIQELQSFNESVDGVPTVREMRNEGPISPYYYKEEFGSWHDSLRVAGIQPTHGVDPDVSREMLLEELQRVDEQTDRPPRRADVDEHGRYPYTLYSEEFESFVHALEEAGIEPDEKQYRFSSVETPAEKQGSANIEKLRSNGPVPGSELPNGISMKDRELGAWKFKVNSGSTQPSDPVYYLDGDHAPELVLRRFFRQNPHVLEYRDPHGIKMEIKNHRPSWVEVGREIVDEFVTSRVPSPATFENLVVIQAHESDKLQYCFESSVAETVDVGKLSIGDDVSVTDTVANSDTDKHPVWGFSRDHKSVWDALSERDGLLFSMQPGVFTHYVPVAETIEDSDVMTTLWIEYEDGIRTGGIETPWPYVVVGTEVYRIDVREEELADELEETLDRTPIQSFGDEAVDPLVTSYGGMEPYLRERSRSAKRATTVERDESESPGNGSDSPLERPTSTPASTGGEPAATQSEPSDRGPAWDTRSDAVSSDGELEQPRSVPPKGTTVEVSPAIGSLVERLASSDDQFADEPATVVDTAVESFLAETVGSELDPERFARDEEWVLSVECNPLGRRLLETAVTADNRFDTADDVIEAALSEYLGLQEESVRLPLGEFDRYRLPLESLIANDDYPCETVDEIVSVALEEHVLGDTDQNPD